MNQQRFKRSLFGDPVEFSLESRMFHGVSLIISLTLFFKALFYSFTSLELGAVVCGIAGVMELGNYYLSRFQKKVKLAITLCATKLSLIMILIYLYNGGLGGNMLLLSAISLFLIILIIPKNQHFFWLLLNMGIVFTMMALEYVYPTIVKQHYLSRTEAFLDLGVTYANVALLLFVGISIFRRSF
uniref:hypothetical protein n=1 Tax=Pedobacter sp. TaxID=1411316 RepID=UPI003D7FA253